MISLVRYSVEYKQEWDDFVSKAKNGTFLFMRDYMDYHADRFQDHSLLFYNDNKLLALLPASPSKCNLLSPSPCGEGRGGVVLSSHPGLTYGGLIMGKDCTAARVCELFRELMSYLKKEGFKELIYKVVPHIYHKYPAEEDLYAMTQVCHAELFQRSISSTIDLCERLPWRKGKHANLIAAMREGITVTESDDYAAFWLILTEALGRRHGLKPVHTLEEMELLHSRFPKNIRLLLAEKEGKTLGGAVLYITDTCIHAQYLCSSEQGDRLHSNEALINHIIKQADVRYFDYGISTEDGGRYLNEGLISSKEGFGCRGVVYDVYKIKTTV